MRVVFLGTSGSVPTKERNPPSIALVMNGEYILMDVGDGTQKQIIKSGLGFSRLKRIFITHLHGDHFLGLFPMLQTMSILRRRGKLEIYSPPGLRDIIDELRSKADFRVTFELEVIEVDRDSSFNFGKYKIKLFRVEHGDVLTFGVRVKEADRPGKFNAEKAEQLGIPPELRGLLLKGIPVRTIDGRLVMPEEVVGPPRPGRLVVYSSDTRPSSSVVENAQGADLLIHDATFRDDLKDRAITTGHSTVGEACEVAKRAGVKMLALTHLSARYKEQDIPLIEEEARKIFPNSFVARDLMSVEIPLPEREIEARGE